MKTKTLDASAIGRLAILQGMDWHNTLSVLVGLGFVTQETTNYNNDGYIGLDECKLYGHVDMHGRMVLVKLYGWTRTDNGRQVRKWECRAHLHNLGEDVRNKELSVHSAEGSDPYDVLARSVAKAMAEFETYDQCDDYRKKASEAADALVKTAVDKLLEEMHA